MADERETPDGAASGSSASTDPATIAVALGHSGTLDPRAAAFLEKQGALSDEQAKVAIAQERVLRLQANDLLREDRLRHWSFIVHHISDVMKLSFELAGAFILIAIATFIGAAVWEAAHDNGLVIDAFNMPADLAAKGLTGEVIATQVQDHISWMQSHVQSIRAPGTFRNNWGDDIKVRIPEAGVTIGELYRYLAAWLGHETHITGEVWRVPDGISLSARAGSEPARVFRGSEANLDKLVAKAAEYVYGRTQPYRYVVFLELQDRAAEALDAARSLALNGPNEEKPWGYTRWGVMLRDAGDFKGGLEKQRIAAQLGPDVQLVFVSLAGAEAHFGHEEAVLRADRRALALLERPNSKQLAASVVAAEIPVQSMMVAEEEGDFANAISQAPRVADAPVNGNTHRALPLTLSADLARDHNVSGSLRVDSDLPNDEFEAMSMKGFGFTWNIAPLPKLMRALALDDWKAAHDDIVATNNIPAARNADKKPLLPVLTWPWLAYVDVRLGDIRTAHALIDKTPGDCYLCVRMRGNIDAAQRNWAGAAYWYSNAVMQAPSIPFAYTDWGAMLAAKGDYGDAIEKFKIANQKGPHFADPLEMWGEALMAKNRSDLALAKFKEANKFAPNWGRLHLKWGEALFYAGQKTEAEKQFAVASQLDLSQPDKAVLAKWMSHG